MLLYEKNILHVLLCKVYYFVAADERDVSNTQGSGMFTAPMEYFFPLVSFFQLNLCLNFFVSQSCSVAISLSTLHSFFLTMCLTQESSEWERVQALYYIGYKRQATWH